MSAEAEVGSGEVGCLESKGSLVGAEGLVTNTLGEESLESGIPSS